MSHSVIIHLGTRLHGVKAKLSESPSEATRWLVGYQTDCKAEGLGAKSSGSIWSSTWFDWKEAGRESGGYNFMVWKSPFLRTNPKLPIRRKLKGRERERNISSLCAAIRSWVWIGPTSKTGAARCRWKTNTSKIRISPRVNEIHFGKEENEPLSDRFAIFCPIKHCLGYAIRRF